MKFSPVSIFALASAAISNGNSSYVFSGVPSPRDRSSGAVTVTTTVVDTLTVPCTGPTTITTNGKTYTATEATTLTITDCPCKITHSSAISSTAPKAEAVASTPSVPAAEVIVASEIVETLTVPCTGPTTITTNGKTYTATDATTLTITDCSCTLTHSSSVAAGTLTSPKAEAATTPGASPSHTAEAHYKNHIQETTVDVTVVHTLTTFITAHTTLTTNGQIFTVNQPTTLTITGLCTVTKSSSAPQGIPEGTPKAPAADVATKSSVKAVETTESTAPVTITAPGKTFTVTQEVTVTNSKCICPSSTPSLAAAASPASESPAASVPHSAPASSAAAASPAGPVVSAPASSAAPAPALAVVAGHASAVNQTAPAIANSASKLTGGSLAGIAIVALLL